MAFLSGQMFGPRLIEALGIRQEHVKSITIRCHADEAVRVTVEHYLTKEECDAVADLLAALG